MSLKLSVDESQEVSESVLSFAEFLIEIDAHFKHVIFELLKWDPKEVKISWGANNVVMQFRHQDQRYLFRVPKHGPFQLKAVHLANSYFKSLNFFPKIIYFDHKCIIEEYIEGEHLHTGQPVHFENLARALAQMHCIPIEGYGPLVYRGQGEFENPDQLVGPKLYHRFNRCVELGYLKGDLPVFERLFFDWYEAYSEMPRVICHGDLWDSNAFCLKNGEVKLIDWESVGAYPFYQDLKMLHNSWMTEENRQHFVQTYEQETQVSLDLSYSSFVGLFKEIRNPKGMVGEKIRRLQTEFLRYASQHQA